MNDNNEQIKNSSKKYTILFGIIFIILIGIIGYLTFTRIMESNRLFKKEDNQQQIQAQEVKAIEKDLDIKSGLVQNLFKLVNVDTVHMKWKDGLGVSAEEMSYEDKFSLAIAAIKNSRVACSSISSEITNIYGNDIEIYCGDETGDYYYFDTETNQWKDANNKITYANLYDEENIISAMYQIFGKDYYERKTIIEDTSYDYTYIESQNGYVMVHGQKGGTKPLLKETLLSAKQIDDEIIINAKGQSEETVNIKYTFKFNKQDNSYYFNKVEITK